MYTRDLFIHNETTSQLCYSSAITTYDGIQKKCHCGIYYSKKAIVAVIVWQLDLLLPMQSVPITTDVVSSNLDQSEVYNII